VLALRPGVVWFDEIPHHLAEIGKIVDDADLATIVSTSSTVRYIRAERRDCSQMTRYIPLLDMHTK
jgi:NAD-dependent SIR2 family protein deacetylase